MKKNITINLCGRLYQIDEDAYELLSQYIDTLRAYFQKQEGGEEIANDIEERVAELFDDLKSKGTEAITIGHVERVIQQIGQVNEIAGEEGGDTSTASTTSATSDNTTQKSLNNKKFFRDSQNKMVAGVLAGCAQYYGGDANVWRCGYVIACLLWCLFCGFNPLNLGGLAAFPILILTMPLVCLPLLPYLLIAIFLPETTTPEDVLRMKGKQVNPQNLTNEVQESNTQRKSKSSTSFWDIFVGILSIGMSTFLTIGFIVALCFFAAFIGASELMARIWWDIDDSAILNMMGIPVIVSGILLLASIAILLYCSIHAATSSFGKTPAMTTRQRIIWFLLWVASLAGFVGSIMYAMGQYQKAIDLRWETKLELRQEQEANDLQDTDTLALDTFAIDSLAIPEDSIL